MTDKARRKAAGRAGPGQKIDWNTEMRHNKTRRFRVGNGQFLPSFALAFLQEGPQLHLGGGMRVFFIF